MQGEWVRLEVRPPRLNLIRTVYRGKPPQYGNFFIILDHFPRKSQLHPAPHARWAVIYLMHVHDPSTHDPYVHDSDLHHPTRAVGHDLLGAHANRVLIGPWDPMLCPNWGFYLVTMGIGC